MYKRVIRLEARREQTGEPFFVTEELRVHCEMEISLAQQLTQAKVTIYNLSRETSNALCYGDHEAGSVGTAESLRRASKVYIRLYAGYEDERLSTGQLPQILEGIVMNASAQRRLPNHVNIPTRNIHHQFCLSFLIVFPSPFMLSPFFVIVTGKQIGRAHV